MKNKKTLIALACLLAVVVVGGTFAYFKYTESIPNQFHLATEKAVITEHFDSPDNWTPCTRTPKTLEFKNESTFNTDVRVRIKSERWEDGTWYDNEGVAHTVELDDTIRFDANGNFIPKTDTTATVDHTTEATITNLINTDKWELKSDGWYYYANSLRPGETAPSFIESVTFSCDAPNEYSSAKYHLELEINTLQSDGRSSSDWL
jgi:alternate signal-mediated exported protein